MNAMDTRGGSLSPPGVSRTLRLIQFLLVVLLAATFAGRSYATPFGPSLYLSSSDSPFAAIDFSGGYFFLENFEDLAVNSQGLTASGGFVTNPTTPNRDSVDADDGTIDGSGSSGHTYARMSALAVVSFTFNSVALGTYPTHAGLVWTDGGSNNAGASGTFTVEGFDASNISIGQVTAVLGDGLITGQTAEDRFIGFESAGGIARIELRNPSSNPLAYLEADHVQYGFVPTTSTTTTTTSSTTSTTIPVPLFSGVGWLTLTGLLGFALRRRWG